MKAEHRKILRELMSLCNDLGGSLDGTATNEAKYRDRQRALMKCCIILYAVLSDHPDNDNREDNFKDAWESIEHLKGLKDKVYPDRNGFITSTPTTSK